jgi:phenylacetate-CoA ligase
MEPGNAGHAREMTSPRAAVFRAIYSLLGSSVGVPVWSTLQDLIDSQYWSRDRLEALQLAKLRSLLEHAYQTVPYYREVMDETGVRPHDVRVVSDLVRLPLLTRKTLQQSFPNSLASTQARHYRVARTGGSTGAPVRFYVDRKVRTIERACYYRFLSWMGYGLGEPMVRLWGAPVVSTPAARLQQFARWQLYRVDSYDAFKLDEQLFETISRRIRQRKPTLLRGYTTALVAFAEYVRAHSLVFPSLKAVTTTAEVLHDYQRRLLQDAFHCGVFDQYGCGEVNNIAANCEMQAGLHVAIEHAIVEIVDDRGLPVAPGQLGHIAVTNLDNYAMPFIRYLNGDQAVASGNDCSCGRQLPMIEKVVGRTVDLIVGLNGRRVHGEFFTHLLHELGWTERLVVTAFRVEQHTKNDLTFDVVARRAPSAADVELLKTKVSEFLGPVELKLRLADEIPASSSGKRRFTLSHVSH